MISACFIGINVKNKGTYSAVIDNMFYILHIPPQVVFVSPAVLNTIVLTKKKVQFLSPGCPGTNR